MKQRTLCLLVSEGAEVENISGGAHTPAVCVCAACMCALFRLWGSHVCLPSVRRVLEGGGDHLHFHLRCFFSGASSITRLGSL